MKFFRLVCLLPVLHFLAACQTTGGGGTSPQNTAGRAAMMQAISAEPRGAYFVGRRYFKTEYKFWGFVRPSGQPWSSAKLVMMNENQRLAPDRAAGKLGSDNDYEYKLTGYFSGDTVYEPASNGFYPEFVLKGYEVRSTSPASIYRESGATNPDYRMIPKPY